MEDIVLNFNPEPPIKCKHCGKELGKHRAVTHECPHGRGSFPSFGPGMYEPRAKRKKKEQ